MYLYFSTHIIYLYNAQYFDRNLTQFDTDVLFRCGHLVNKIHITS